MKALDQFLKYIKSSDTYRCLADKLKNSDFGKALKSYATGISNYLDAQKKTATKLPDVSATLAIGGSGANGGSPRTGWRVAFMSASRVGADGCLT